MPVDVKRFAVSRPTGLLMEEPIRRGPPHAGQCGAPAIETGTSDKDPDVAGHRKREQEGPDCRASCSHNSRATIIWVSRGWGCRDWPLRASTESRRGSSPSRILFLKLRRRRILRLHAVKEMR